jgi:hypothetical protein
MQSKAKSVADYLAELPAERRAEVQRVRSVILANLDKGFVEMMQYGMIGYAVPHSIYPPGYHCKPEEPLPYAALAAQKNAYSLYVMALYMAEAGAKASALRAWFDQAWAKSGKKLDMGKACIRFKKADDLALDVIGELFKRVTAKSYIEVYTSALGDRAAGAKPKTSAKPAAKAKTGAKAGAAKAAGAKSSAGKPARAAGR